MDREESLVVSVNKEGGIAVSASLYIGFVVCVVYASLTFIVGMRFSSAETYFIIGFTFTVMQVINDYNIVLYRPDL